MYDLLALTFNEEKHSRLNENKICIKAVNKKGHKQAKYYYEIWPFINNCYGILYKLFTKDGLGSFECCDEMFEFNTVDNKELNLGQFIPSATGDCVEDWVSMKLNADYREEFIAVLDELLSCSPISTIAFLCSGQSCDREVVVGNLSRNDFIKMLCSGDIRTNICYIVTVGQ